MLQQVKELYAQQFLLEGVRQEEVPRLIPIVQQLAKDNGGLMLPVPRRGADYEHNIVALELEELEQKDAKQEDKDTKRQKQDTKVTAESLQHRLKQVYLEKWREAEALLLAPHIFEKLRQLPELQQIISFTAVNAVAFAGAPGWHLNGAAEAAEQLPPPSHTSSPEVVAAMRACPATKGYMERVTKEEADLFDTLSPHMRLALAAEVAAGMLCPGQPPPPDTAEHAAALQLFIELAFRELDGECGLSSDILQTTTAVRVSKLFTAPSRAQQLKLIQPFQHSADTMPGFVPHSSKLRSWGLAPLVDLQMHVPPQQLLQRVLQLRGTLQGLPDSYYPIEMLHSRHASSPRLTELEEAAVLGSLLHPCLRQALRQDFQQQQLQHLLASRDQGTAAARPGNAGSSQSSELAPGQQGSRGQPDGSECSSSDSDPVRALVAAILGPDYSIRGLTHKAVSEITRLAYCFVARFLQDQLSSWGADSAQWQQAVPLQALQLVSAVRQLEAAGQAAVAAAQQIAAGDIQWQRAPAGSIPESPTAAAAAGGEGCDAAAAPAERQMVDILLSLMQHARCFQDCNAALRHSSHTGSSSGAQNNIRTTGSPSVDFAADGPFSSWSAQTQPGLGAGFWWQPPLSETAAAAGSTAGPAAGDEGTAGLNSCSSQSSSRASSTHSTSRHAPPEGPPLAAARSEAAWTALLAAGLSHEAVQFVGAAITAVVADGSVSQACQRTLKELVDDRRVCELIKKDQNVWHEVQRVLRFFAALGQEIDEDEGIAHCIVQHALLSAVIQSSQKAILRDLGAAAESEAWGELLSSCASVPGLPRAMQLTLHRSHSSTQGGLPKDLHLSLQPATAISEQGSQQLNSPDWDQWGVTEGTAAAQHAAAPWYLGTHRLSTSGISSLKDLHGVGPFLRDGQRKLRYILLKTAEQLDLPVATLVHTLAARVTAIAAGRTAPAEHGGSTPDGQPGHSKCSKCREEGLQQQSGRPTQHVTGHGASSAQHGPSPGTTTTSTATSSSSGPPITCQWPVPYDDPFLWRRLLWRLLGKLSPEAQAFYIRQGMCPHNSIGRMWHRVRRSILHCLWSPGNSDLTELSLCSTSRPFQERARCLRQYSRALNKAFVGGYHPSTVLLSKQVLLALSPLHHQVLPPAEVAHFLPSSFGPAIGKALMQALCEVPVLDGFEHQHCPLQLWHVWWHVGLRVYQQLQRDKQQEQQGQKLHGPKEKQSRAGRGGSSSGSRAVATSQSNHSKHTPPTRTVSSSSSSSKAGGPVPIQQCQAVDNLQVLSGPDLEALYLNPDARLFAVGYATRQLSGLPGRKPEWEVEMQSLLHASARHALHNQAECLLAAVPSLREQQQHLQQGSAGGSSGMEEAFQRSLDAALLMTDALACRQHQLLAAASGPRDLLIPPAQQKVPPHGKVTVGLCQAMRLYLGHCPVDSARKSSLQQQQQHTLHGGLRMLHCELPQPRQVHKQVAADRLNMQQRDCLRDACSPYPTNEQQLSDVAALALSSPCPVEALLDPEVWWSWQQALLKLDTCDTCGADTGDQAVICSSCQGVQYCSLACKLQDKAHDVMCDKLRQALQRYSSADASRPCGSSFPGLSALLKPGERCELGGMASPCLAQPTFTPHGNSLVPARDFVSAAAAAMDIDSDG